MKNGGRIVLRLAAGFLSLASLGIVASTSSYAAPSDGKKCVFPDDCLRHFYLGVNMRWGTCESSSAWHERYIHGTPDERVRMWKERGKRMGERILDAYRLTEAQKEKCSQIREEFWADRRREMGKEQFEEGRALRTQTSERLREYTQTRREVQDGAPGAAEAWAKLPPLREDPELGSLNERLDEIKRDHPIDWSELADRVEDALPQEQAKRGRERLAEKFPLTVSRRHGEKLATGNPKTAADGADAADIDRWEAYVRDFTARYQLSPAQSNAAQSILHEVQARATQLTHSMRDEVERYQAGGSQEEARRRREVFQFDLDDLSEGFKARLRGLLTTAQQQRPTTP